MALERYSSLYQLIDHVWDQIGHGVEQPGHPYHSPTLGTTGAEGPNLRTVILRQIDISTRALLFHSDRRAEKIRELERDARVMWHFWYPEQREQLRLRGHATLHFTDAIADQLWQDSSPQSLKLYVKSQPPGTKTAQPQSGLPEQIQLGQVTHSDLEAGRQHFSVVRTEINEIEVLHLREDGNYRAYFQWDNNQATSSWIIP
jgi:pyridoxamine 5'-phosphate oxidase